MPYGMPKDMGGDMPEVDRKMEHCVNSIMSKNKGMSKESAIKICKSQMMKGAKRG